MAQEGAREEGIADVESVLPPGTVYSDEQIQLRQQVGRRRVWECLPGPALRWNSGMFAVFIFFVSAKLCISFLDKYKEFKILAECG